MKLNSRSAGKLRLKPAYLAPALLLILTVVPSTLAHAQSTDSRSSDAKATDGRANPGAYKTIFFTNLTQQNDLTDVQTDLRNMIPGLRIYGIPSQHAISIHGSPEDIALAEKIAAEFDKPKAVFRLTYTLSESDGGKSVVARSFQLIAASGDKTTFKQGERVPIVTGKYDVEAASAANTQVQYLDVGLNIDVTADAFADGVRLRSKVEQSSVSDEKSGNGPQDPIVRQNVLENTALLALGKPLTLGSMDAPGTAHKQELSVVAERLK